MMFLPRVRHLKHRLLAYALISSLLLAAGWAPAPGAAASEPERPAAARVGGDVMFVENVGQFAAAARFQARGAGGTLWLADDGLWITVHERAPEIEVRAGLAIPRGEAEYHAPPRRAASVRLSFAGANTAPRLEPFNRLDTVMNYYLGDNPARWRAGAPVWGGVRYVDLYPGLDLEINGEGGQLAPRLVARTGADPSAVRLRVEGAETVAVEGRYLRLTTAAGEFSMPLLQWAGGSRPAPPTVAGDMITSPFAPSGFPSAQSEVQDVAGTLLFSTYLGGSQDDQAKSLAADASGAYVTGYTASADFPTTVGGHDGILGGSFDVFVTKVLTDGSGLVFSTYLGGNYQGGGSLIEESGLDIAVDSAAAVYLTGWTFSSDFPTTTGAFDTSFNGATVCPDISPARPCSDAFVAKLDQTGALAYSTFLGGSKVTIPGLGPSAGDDAGEGIAVDGSGKIYVTGRADSDDFPTTAGAYDRVFADVDVGLNVDVFVSKIDPAGQGANDLLYSTYVGAGYPERGTDIVLDQNGFVHVAGKVDTGFFSGITNPFPTTSGAFDETFNGGLNGDAIYFKMNLAGQGASDLLYATYLGGSGDDLRARLAVDAQGRVYLLGYTASADFPTTPGALDATCGLTGTCDGRSDAFVSQINPAGQGASDLLYSTYLGGNNFENISDEGGLAVDSQGDIYVSGQTSSTDLATTAGAFDSTHNGGFDAFVIRLRPAGQGAADLVYGTYLGGSGSDRATGLFLDSAGTAYVAGYTNSSNFPTTAGAFDTSFGVGSGSDAFVAKILLANPASNNVDAFVQTQALAGGPPGGLAVVPVGYGNQGAATAASVVLTAALGSGLTYLDDNSGLTPVTSTSMITWTLPNLPFASRGEINMRVAVPTGTIGTRYPITWGITSAGPEDNAGNNTASLAVMVAHQVFAPFIQR